METTFKNRLLEFLDYLKVGQTKFEENAGLGRASISKIKDGMSSPNLAKITRAYPELNINWLITGEGSMLKNGNITNTITGDSNTTLSNTGGGHNVSIGGDTKAKKIIGKDKVIVELEQSTEFYKQKSESLETRIKDLESLLKAKDEIIEMLKSKL